MKTNPGHDLSGIAYTGAGNHAGDQIALLVSKWNPEVTGALLKGALFTLEAAGVPRAHIHVHEVPGTYELASGAQLAIEGHGNLDAVICLGCVIQGETRHFDFICDAAAQGIMRVSLDYSLPVIFGVLTPNTQQQALDRAGGILGNKGQEAAVAALEMIDLRRAFPG
jgi:6,7-dimethyl-8-ribityllumazine synthase